MNVIKYDTDVLMYHHIFRFGGKVFSFVLAENKIVKAVEAHEDNPHED